MARWHAWLESLGDALFHARGRATRFAEQGGVAGASADAAKKAALTWRQLKDPKQLRKLLKSNQVVVSILALVVIAGSIIVLFVRLAPPTAVYAPGQMWFYDVGSGQLFAGPETEVPVVTAPSGALLGGEAPGGVGVAVFACGDCRTAPHKIGYLATRVPTAVATRLMPDVELDDASIGQVWIMAAPPGPGATATAPADRLQWHPADSPEAKAIRADVEKLCGGAPPTPCDSP